MINIPAVMKKTKNPTPIEIRKSNLYSLDLVDGQPVIWVSGKCGWYEIKPSPTYQHVYNEMCEAIKFYFYLLDIYTERALKRDNNKSSAALSQILLKVCAALVRDPRQSNVYSTPYELATAQHSRTSQHGVSDTRCSSSGTLVKKNLTTLLGRRRLSSSFSTPRSRYVRHCHPNCVADL